MVKPTRNPEGEFMSISTTLAEIKRGALAERAPGYAAPVSMRGRMTGTGYQPENYRWRDYPQDPEYTPGTLENTGLPGK
jgi:hypothetical protein